MKTGISAAFAFILLGILLLLHNFGVLPWSFWVLLWRFWPTLLILLGLELLIGQQAIGKVITLLIAIIFLGLILVLSLFRTHSSLDRWLQNRLPQWESWKNYLPSEDQPLPSPFGQKGHKVFRCDPQTGECRAVYK